MLTKYRLIRLLADGQFHSGTQLGQQLGITRAAVWKHIKSLKSLGLEVYSLPGKGHQLPIPFKPLDPLKIAAECPGSTTSRQISIEVFDEIDSTSEYLKQKHYDLKSSQGRACLAEFQCAGRGRRGRNWVALYGGSLCLSLLLNLQKPGTQLSGLSLVAAVAVLRALEQCGVHGLALKWPNDIYLDGRKLAGILLDLTGEIEGPCQLIAGVGLNVRLSENKAEKIDQPWSDLTRTDFDGDRNQLAGRVLKHLLQAIDEFLLNGLALFAEVWKRYDLIVGKSVNLHYGNQVISGVAKGIDDHGALMIEKNGRTRSYHSGEVSVRLTTGNPNTPERE